MNPDESNPSTPILYRLVTPNDINGLVDTMLKVGLSVARIKSRAMYTAICKEGLSHPEVWIAVAVDGCAVTGFVVNVTNWKAFWKGFALRHPFLGLAMLLARYYRQAGELNQDTGIDQYLNPAPMTESWSDSSPQIAKVVCIGVDPSFHRRGIGPGLYRFMFGALHKRAVTRYDAKIDRFNIASAKLHQKTGWTMVQANGRVFATIRIPVGNK